jgi:AraC family transcriptional regulator
MVGPFILHERLYPAHFRTPRHRHDRPLFCFVVKGSYTETYGSKTRACQPSTLLFHAPGEEHAEEFHGAGGCSFLVEIEQGWLEHVSAESRVINTSFDCDGGVLSLLAARIYREFGEPDDLSPLVIEGLMFELIGETSRHARGGPTSPPPKWLTQARQLLHDSFSEPVTLAEIAAAVGVHPAHLAKSFHRFYNCTVGVYIRRQRIDFACKALATTDLPLSQIALAAGFSDQSHLTRLFKRQMAVSPAQYRAMLRLP